MTILESSRCLSSAGGWATRSPASAASASVSSSNITNTARPPGPCERTQLVTSGWREQVVADVLDRLELAARCRSAGHEHVRVAAVERVEVGDVVEVAHPAVDPEQVERGRRDEVDRRLVGAEELPQAETPRSLAGVVTGASFPLIRYQRATPDNVNRAKHQVLDLSLRMRRRARRCRRWPADCR